MSVAVMVKAVLLVPSARLMLLGLVMSAGLGLLITLIVKSCSVEVLVPSLAVILMLCVAAAVVTCLICNLLPAIIKLVVSSTL